MCENKELLVGYLYDDLTAEERRAFDAHLPSCASCREELAGLRAARGHLSAWAPPEPEFNFRIVRQPVGQGGGKIVPFRSRWIPGFGLAAAAVLVLAAATAIANLEVRYGNDGFTVRTGWARGEAQTAGQPSKSAVPVNANARAEFEALERRLDQLEAATASPPADATMQVTGMRMSDAQMLRRVREIVREAEDRQEVAVARQLLQVMQDFEKQRRTDLALLEQGTAQYQGLTNAQLAEQRDMVNQLMRVANRQEK